MEIDSLARWLGGLDRTLTTPIPLQPAAKRGLDVSLAVLALLVLSPLLLAIALAIKLDSRGPVFYRVRRVGFRGTPLHMLKFRKMHHDAAGGPLTAGRDPRLTAVGALLTRFRLDELPQLWDVLRGRMSLVGPRPEDPRFVALHPEAYERILDVRPGITGLSQLAFAEEAKILQPQDIVADYVSRILPQKVALDTMYASSCAVRRDLGVLVWTAKAMVLRRPVAVHRGTGALSMRRRPAAAPVAQPCLAPADAA